jgi:hypothetical protein
MTAAHFFTFGRSREAWLPCQRPFPKFGVIAGIGADKHPLVEQPGCLRLVAPAAPLLANGYVPATHRAKRKHSSLNVLDSFGDLCFK